jgi:hypothetical protein
MYLQPERLRKVGRPRARWRDEVGKDARMLGLPVAIFTYC